MASGRKNVTEDENIDLELESGEENEPKPAKKAQAASRKGSGTGARNTSGKSTKKKSDKGNNLQEPRSSRTIHQFLPYLWLVLAIFLLVAFILIDLAHKTNALGPVGYWINNALFGILGYGAFAVPFILLILAYRWRQFVDCNQVGKHLIFSMLIVLMLSAIIHAIAHHSPDETYSIARSFCQGCGISYTKGDVTETFSGVSGGGVLGALIGFVSVKCLSLVGTLIILIAMLIFLIMIMVGMTPQRMWTEIRFRSRKYREKRAEKKKAGEEQTAAERYNDPTRDLVGADRKRKPGIHYDGSNYDEVHAVAPYEENKKGKAGKKADAIIPADSNDGLELNTEALDDNYVPARQPEAAAPAKGNRKKGSAFGVGDSLMADLDEIPEEEPAETDESFAPEEESGLAETEESLNHLDEEASRPIILAAPEEEPAVPDEEPEPEPEETTFKSGNETEKTKTVVFGEEPVKSSPKDDIKNKATIRKVDKIEDTFVNLDDGDSTEHVAAPVDEEKHEYMFPPLNLLKATDSSARESDEVLTQKMRTLEETLNSFNVQIRDMSYASGPTVTRYELKPAPGVRIKSIANLSDDIAMSLASTSGIRIEAPIPGKDAVGIEVPNVHRATVGLKELIASPAFVNHKSKVAACLGADITGNPVVFDIAKMPHMLIAGTTGSGKSVCINSIVMSLLYKATPDEVKLIMIDPKAVEFSVYRDIPHLYAPIVSNSKKAAGALAVAVGEMERRYSLIAEAGVRDIFAYNAVTANDPDREYLPQIVIIIDELADLMMVAKSEVETSIVRIAQKARAAGMYLILGTQRPSVDVVTGLIKANVPSRIAFTVSSQVDSKTIIDYAGAEKLCGRGDMLFAPIGCSKPQRCQGAFVDDKEVEAVVEYVKSHNDKAKYNEDFVQQIETETAKLDQKQNGGPADLDDEGSDSSEDSDPKFMEALEVAVDMGKISTSLLQRKCEVGYGRAAKLIDTMEEKGFVSAPDGNKPRKVLITKEEFYEMRTNQG